jgi:hypothetical protein
MASVFLRTRRGERSPARAIDGCYGGRMERRDARRFVVVPRAPAPALE